MSSKKNSLVLSEKTQKVVRLIPPDGGWGWMVLLGTAMSNIVNQSMLSLLSLLYGDAIESMGYETQGNAILLSTMLFFTNCGGPMAGALVKLSSTRVVAVCGAISCTTGIFLSGFSTNIWHLVLTYGFLLGMGLGFIQNSSFVAINSYFKLKKSRAVGLANVGTGVGQALMPHLVRYLLDNYGFTGACLILSGLSLNGICGVLLIQPVQWHMKKVVEEVVVNEKLHLLQNERKMSEANGNTHKTKETQNGNEKSSWPSKAAQSNKELNGSKINKSDANGLNGHNNNQIPRNRTLGRKLYDLFGISLLSDLRFLNIVIGTALAVTSVQNFSMVFPLFLQKVANADKQQTANCMSAVATADIVGRLILPVFQDKFKVKARWMLIMTCIWLIIVRQILAYQTDITVLLAMACLYGIGRSMTIVARNIAISENCRMDQVPAAVGLGMLTMGIIVPPVGYFLGWIRDFTDSYIICITAQNILLVILLVTWIPDMLYLWMQEKREKKKEIETQMYSK